MTKEYAVGEVFEYKGKKLKVVVGMRCDLCHFSQLKSNHKCLQYNCFEYSRSDETPVHFEVVE